MNDRQHLTKKPITDVNGKQTSVYVNPNKGTGEANAKKLSALAARPTTTRPPSEISPEVETILDKIDSDVLDTHRAKPSERFPNTMEFTHVTPRDLDSLIDKHSHPEVKSGRVSILPDIDREGVLIDARIVSAFYSESDDAEEQIITIRADDTYLNAYESDYTVYVTSDEKVGNDWINEFYAELEDEE